MNFKKYSIGKVIDKNYDFTQDFNVIQDFALDDKIAAKTFRRVHKALYLNTELNHDILEEHIKLINNQDGILRSSNYNFEFTQNNVVNVSLVDNESTLTENKYIYFPEGILYYNNEILIEKFDFDAAEQQLSFILGIDEARDIENISIYKDTNFFIEMSVLDDNGTRVNYTNNENNPITLIESLYNFVEGNGVLTRFHGRFNEFIQNDLTKLNIATIKLVDSDGLNIFALGNEIRFFYDESEGEFSLSSSSIDPNDFILFSIIVSNSDINSFTLIDKREYLKTYGESYVSKKELYTKSIAPNERKKSIFVPMFFKPDFTAQSGQAWTDLQSFINTVEQFPNVNYIVAINPNDGAGVSVDQDYYRMIKTLRGLGVSVVGYVSTKYSPFSGSFSPTVGASFNDVETLETIENEVDNWLSLYPMIDGIYLDEVPFQTLNSAAKNAVTYYRKVDDYIHDAGFDLTIANVGEIQEDDSYFKENIFDIVITYNKAISTPITESEINGDKNDFNSIYHYTPHKKAVIANTLSNTTTITNMNYLNIALENVDYVYFTNGSDYTSLASYFETFVRFVNSYNNSGILTFGNLELHSINGTISIKRNNDSKQLIESNESTYRNNNLFKVAADNNNDVNIQLDSVNNVINLNVNEAIVSNDLIVNGNLTVNGTTTTVDSTNMTVTDNIIVLNQGESGSGVSLIESGLEVDRGTSTNYKFIFNETTDTFRIGIDGSTQAVATRENNPNNNGIATWNNTSKRYDADELTLENGSLNHPSNFEVNINGLGALSINSSREVDINNNLTINGLLLRDSDDRSGLLQVRRKGSTAWSGHQIRFSSTSLWSVMGRESDFALYDDFEGEYFLRYSKNGGVELYYNGSSKLTTTGTGITVTGNVSANNLNVTNWNAAYTHISNDGTDHTYINQDLRTTASPTFSSLTVSGSTRISGHLGVGVAPSGTYDIYANGGSSYGIRAHGSTMGGRFEDSAGTARVYVAYGSYGIYQNLGSTNYFTGKVGIGRAPSYKLDVNGNARVTGLAKVDRIEIGDGDRINGIYLV